MTLAPGTRLGPYEITAPLGAGGMGEVYRARDPRIGRDVALKVLPAAFAGDAERLRRFEQEARSAGVLNHPNILAIHDVGSHEGAPYVVSELLEGETLRERIDAGALPPRKAVETAIQIATGLAAAHEHGIIHRDLKPENIFITRDGRVKILDFGLAKLTAAGREGAAGSEGRTLPADTGPGTIWGTVGYMSPEQVRGKAVDHRSDIFAFGAILYEMVSGKRAFHGDTPADTMSAILKEDPPDLAQLIEGIPPALERLVRHCLEKNPGERFQSARDLAFNLEAMSGLHAPGSGSAPVLVEPARARRPARLLWSAAAAAVVVLAALLIPGLLHREAPDRLLRVTLEPPPGGRQLDFLYELSLSPDGRWVVFGVADSGGTGHLWLRGLDAPSPQPIPGTDDGTMVFWSPDSRTIGFASRGKLRRVPVAGGPVQEICDAPDPRGVAWGKTGVILFAPGATGGLVRVAAEGGKPEPVTSLDSTRNETAHRWPCFLPDGKRFLYLSIPGKEGEFQTYVGSLDSPKRSPVLRSARAALYANPGLVVYSKGDLLMAQRFDPGRAETRGEPVMLAEAPTNIGTVGMPIVSISQNGLLAYRSQQVGNTVLEWYSVAGDLLGRVPAPPGRYEGGMPFSRDGRRVVVTRRESHSNRDLWLIELDRGTASRLTFAPENETSPVWSPDGSRIAYTSDREGGVQNLYARPVSGGEEETLLKSGAQWKSTMAWSPDGRYLVFYQLDPQTKADLWLLPLEGDRKPVPWLRTPFTETAAEISPDGRWIAYVSDESGKSEIYVQSFPEPGSKRQVSTDGGGGPAWLPDGRGIVYTTLGGGSLKVMRADVRVGTDALETAAPRVIGTWPLARVQGIAGGSLARDGTRFLLARETGENAATIPALLVNWPAVLKR